MRREYIEHVPVTYSPSVRTPLVLFFHGAGGTAAGADADSGWSQLADRDRFIVAYPQALRFGRDGPTAWASVGPVDYGIEDLAFVRTVLAALRARLCIATGAVYAVGMSSGGGMAGALACELSGQIAAVAPVAANNYVLTKLGCRPRRPVALLEIHGTADRVVPYDGIPARLNPSWPLPSVRRWMRAWSRLDHCRPSARPEQVAPHQTLIVYPGCAPGVAVELYRLDGAGHVYPSQLGGRPADAVIYSYFQRHRR